MKYPILRGSQRTGGGVHVVERHSPGVVLVRVQLVHEVRRQRVEGMLVRENLVQEDPKRIDLFDCTRLQMGRSYYDVKRFKDLASVLHSGKKNQ